VKFIGIDGRGSDLLSDTMSTLLEAFLVKLFGRGKNTMAAVIDGN
jgi:hypothetical protein